MLAKRLARSVLPFVLVLALPFLVAFRALEAIAGIPEPWATILFAFVAPLVVQLIGKIFKAPEVQERAYQVAALVLTLVFVALSGGFAGISIPAFPALPVLAGDVGTIIGAFLVFLGALVTYLAAWIRIVLASWGSVELSYRLVLKWFMEKKLRFLKPEA